MYCADGLPTSATFPWLFSHGYGPPGGSPPNNLYATSNNPYNFPGNFGNPPPKKSKFWLIFGIVSGVLVLSCCGCGGIGFYLVHAVINGAGQVAVAQYKDHPLVQEHLGNISKSAANYSSSFDEEDDADGGTTFVYDVEGSKGKGQIIGSDNEPSGSDKMVLKNVRLRLPDGREFQLSPEVPGNGGIQNLESSK